MVVVAVAVHVQANSGGHKHLANDERDAVFFRCEFDFFEAGKSRESKAAMPRIRRPGPPPPPQPLSARRDSCDPLAAGRG